MTRHVTVPPVVPAVPLTSVLVPAKNGRKHRPRKGANRQIPLCVADRARTSVGR